MTRDLVGKGWGNREKTFIAWLEEMMTWSLSIELSLVVSRKWKQCT